MNIFLILNVILSCHLKRSDRRFELDSNVLKFFVFVFLLPLLMVDY